MSLLGLGWGLMSLAAAEPGSKVAPAPSTSPRKELAAVRQELAPVRQRAEALPEVTRAREAVQTALTNYYAVLRANMVELDPASRPLIERERELRLKVRAGGSGR